ncbi:MAG: phosphatase PAP2 family protein [Candidatus Abyssobacteria bacterium SURF_17]|uniref:Phosphatase PAP2 family protein n=1 Tax=Candidatus Abyssobacteria bacterium SURF_17 TaxID=2093361 RepID=A0A419F6H0_9BACT|nr:MAG: phosphatase PAP2 family protein [Candidatus Abyssubacteria bacterium SURF_17]
MAELPFSLALIRFLADNRIDLLTILFQFFTFLGETEGYILVIALIYVMYDKKLAFRLSVLTLFMMSLNHFLKMLIRNPRPFISEGTYAEKWAVSAEKAQELATEYSTPSGHAMAGSAFYSYLYASAKNRYVRIIAILLLLLTGLSRPYLGVHYLEDVLIGWAIGITVTLIIIKYAENIHTVWSTCSYRQQVTIVVISSVMLWLITRVLTDWSIDGQPLAFVGYAGFLTGIVVAYPLETQKVNFDPRSSPALFKILRYVLSVGMVIGTLLLLDKAFTLISTDYSLLGYALRYIRYTIAGIVAMFLAPVLFVRLGLAETIPKR